ncbi:MAG TPA: YihY/virulence factor BrkB family protein [Candidatus Polarisedimenticolaceae bacterium]
MKILRRAVRIAWQSWRHFQADHAMQHAAAVAYYSLLSLAPGLYLFFRVLRGLWPETSIEGIDTALEPYLPGEAGAVLRSLTGDLPHGKGFVAIAVPGLLWLASAAFGSLEVSINVAFATAPRRRYWLSKLKSVAGVSFLAIVLIVTLLVHEAITQLAAYDGALKPPFSLAPTAAWVSYVVVLVVTFATFAVLYKALPRGRVEWTAAAAGGGATLLLWEVARHVWGGLLAHSPTFGMFTGTLAAVVAFLLWIFTAVAITLYGAEVAAILNGNRSEAGDPTRRA